MSGRVFSVILLPTSECNVACDYCFEHKEPHRLSPALLPLLTKRLLDHLENERIEECEIYWQGGEAMIMGPAWFADAGAVMDQAAAKRGRRFVHYLQTNLISYSSAWNDVIHGMFSGSIGTSMDYPNVHRKLFRGGAEAYTDLWTRRLREAKAAGIEVGVIAVLHQASLEAGPERFYRYFTEELELCDFQVNTPFPGGPAKQLENDFKLDLSDLARFLVGLFDIWIARGYESGVSLGPFDGLIDHFTGKQARLPCIWKENCSNQFISVDSKGTVAQCDCWVTSYPEYFFGNVFQEPDLTRMLKTSRARRDFVERPKRLVEDEDCLSCRYLSICHGGCPVRTYSALGTMMAKDPYCEVYKAVFACAEAHGREILRSKKKHTAKSPAQGMLDFHLGQSVGTVDPAPLLPFELVELQNKCSVRHMKRVEAKIEENRKEDSASEPDKDPNTWLIEAKVDEDIFDWENVRLEFQIAEIEAEIIESSMSEPNRFTVRTHGESPLKKGDVIHVDIREQNQG